MVSWIPLSAEVLNYVCNVFTTLAPESTKCTVARLKKTFKKVLKKQWLGKFLKNQARFFDLSFNAFFNVNNISFGIVC
jgi:hypothetical protein